MSNGNEVPCSAVIIHGPKECGKTRNAQALVEALGLVGVVDGWEPNQKIKNDYLHLTNWAPEEIALPDERHGLRILPFHVAMAECGLAPVRSVNQADATPANIDVDEIFEALAWQSDARLNLVASELAVAEEKMTDRRGDVSENQFQVGDVVTLKSGGAGMTVTELGCCASVECCWFEYGNEMQARNFPLIALKAFNSQADEMPF